jgi:hypothetical protein
MDAVLAPHRPQLLAGLRGRVVDAVFWPRLAGGTGRDTTAAIEAAGFRLGEITRFALPAGPVPVPASPHVRGTASPHVRGTASRP